MSPKEKAIELIEKFRLNVTDYGGSGMNIFKAKQCALIAVNEIMEVCYYTKEVENNDLFSYDYWIEVKTEIKKL